jgi:hypothetical protein
MRDTIIYPVTAVSLFAILVIWKVYRSIRLITRQKALTWVRKLLLDTLVYRRRKSTDSVNLFSLLYTTIYIGSNVVLCALGNNDRNELASRCGTLFLINLVPLFLGGRLSLLTDRMTRVQPWNQSLAHRWIGRVCLLQGVLHGILNMVATQTTLVHIIVSHRSTIAVYIR